MGVPIGVGNDIDATTLLVEHNPDGTHKANVLRMVGEVTIWPTTAAPSGWLLCDGSAVSRTTYAALFAVIGTTFGAGDGSTTFNLPDARGRTVVGRGTQIDVDNIGDHDTYALAARTPWHWHDETAHEHNQKMGVQDTNVALGGTVLASGASGAEIQTFGGSGGATRTRVLTGAAAGGPGYTLGQWGVPYLTLNYIIKV